MKKLFRCLPTGALPYTNDKSATKMMVKLFENIPYLACLPNAAQNETILHRTLMGIPGIRMKEKKILFKGDAISLKPQLNAMDVAYNNPNSENLASYGFDTCFLPKYFQIIERIKPDETVINLMGPFTVSQLIVNEEGTQLLADKYYRKFVIQAVSLKALWIMGKIKELSPETRPLILFEEPLLHKIGDVKRVNEEVTREVIVNMFSKVFSKIKENGGTPGVQCFKKCDWKIPIDAGVKFISFDAYNNPNNLDIMAEKINEFLVHGGRINWAIVPVLNETLVKNLTVDYMYDRFINTIENLINAGTSERLTYNSSTVSVQGNMDRLPLIFAEKALILSSQLSKKIPVKS